MSLQLHLYRGAAWLLPRLPLPFWYRLAEQVGDLLWLVAGKLRADVEHNQRHALGPDATPREVARSSRTVLRNLAKLYVDEMFVPHYSNAALLQRVRIQGLTHLEQALAQGRGALMISAHYGAPQLVGQILVALGYPTTVVVEHLQPEELFQFICQLRESHGIRLLPVDESMLPLIRTLRKENGVVGLVVDRNLTDTGLCLPFLGEETRVADGAVRLALRTKAPIVVGYCRRLPDDTFEAVVQPFALPDVTDGEEAVREGTLRLLACLEAFIREEPGQWLMTVPLWQHGCGAAPL